MIDIVSVHDGLDLGLFDTQAPRASNILSVQTDSLEYAPDLGIDLRFFLQNDFKFENASFKAYLIEVLARNAINVASLVDVVDDLFHTYKFNLAPAEESTGLVVR